VVQVHRPGRRKRMDERVQPQAVAAECVREFCVREAERRQMERPVGVSARR
jgi:hypothetical protein